MKTRPDIIRNHRPMLSVLLIAVVFISPLRTQFGAPVITTESTIVLQTAGAPFLQTTSKIKGDVRWESKESIQ